MSTRCQIGFYEDDYKSVVNDWQVLIYRHWDGYPEGVLPDILPILQELDKGRGLSDIEYGSAWLVAKLKDDFLNIGICKGFHSDIEYVYAVTPKRIDVYDVTMFGKNGASDGFWDNQEDKYLTKIDSLIISEPLPSKYKNE